MQPMRRLKGAYFLILGFGDGRRMEGGILLFPMCSHKVPKSIFYPILFGHGSTSMDISCKWGAKGKCDKACFYVGGLPHVPQNWWWANQMPRSGREKKKELWLHPLTKQ